MLERENLEMLSDYFIVPDHLLEARTNNSGRDVFVDELLSSDVTSSASVEGFKIQRLSLFVQLCDKSCPQ